MGRDLKYPWDRLKQRGDWVLIPDVEAYQVNASASMYIRRHLGSQAKVVAATVPDGTVVFLAHDGVMHESAT